MSRWLAMMVLVTGCAVDYGPPTDATAIGVSSTGGLGGETSGFDLLGTTVRYTHTDGSISAATLSTDIVAKMIGELEKVSFLSMNDPAGCTVIATDGFRSTISVDLSAGSRVIVYDDCGIAELDALVQNLDELSTMTD